MHLSYKLDLLDIVHTINPVINYTWVNFLKFKDYFDFMSKMCTLLREFITIIASCHIQIFMHVILVAVYEKCESLMLINSSGLVTISNHFGTYKHILWPSIWKPGLCSQNTLVCVLLDNRVSPFCYKSLKLCKFSIWFSTHCKWLKLHLNNMYI